jgi:hypothetical protein
MSMLAVELTDKIIDYFQASPSDLKIFSLVCRAWHPRSRSHLFHDFTFPPRRLKLSVSPQAKSPSSRRIIIPFKVIEDLTAKLSEMMSHTVPPISTLVKNLTIDGRGSRDLLYIYNTGFLKNLPFKDLQNISIQNCDCETYASSPSLRCLQSKSLTGLIEKNLDLMALGIRRVWFERIEELLGIINSAINPSHPRFRSVTLDTIDVVFMQSKPLEPTIAWQHQALIQNHAHGGAHAHVCVGLAHLPDSSTYLRIPELRFLGNMPWLPKELLCALQNRSESFHYRAPTAPDTEMGTNCAIGSADAVGVLDVNTLDAYIGIFKTWRASITCLKLDLKPGRCHVTACNNQALTVSLSPLSVINDMHSPVANSFPILDQTTDLELYSDIKTRQFGLELKSFTSCMVKFLPHFPHLRKLSLLRVPASGHRNWRTAHTNIHTNPGLTWIESDTSHDQVLEDLSEAELKLTLGLLRMRGSLDKHLEEIIVGLDDGRDAMRFKFAIEDE